MKNKLQKKAFTIAEIVVATAVFTLAFASLMMLLTSSRTETSKSINYLRALQLAQEAIDWIDSTPFNHIKEENLELLKGNLVDGKIPIGNNGKNSITDPRYPEDYSKAYFYRTVTIEPDTLFDKEIRRFLKKVTVGVYWNEGSAPKNPEATENGMPIRTRKLLLSTIIFNDEAVY